MTASQEDRLAGRNGSIWRDYCAGRNQEWLAARYGISQQRVSQICSEIRTAMPEESREDWRVHALEITRHFLAELVALVDAPPVTVYDREGNAIELNHSDRLAAIDRWVKLQERAARTLGTDAPEQYRSEQTVHYTINGVDPEELK